MEGPLKLEPAARLAGLERIVAFLLAERAESSGRGDDWIKHRLALLYNLGVEEIRAVRANPEISTGQKVRDEERIRQVNASIEMAFEEAAIMSKGIPSIPEDPAAGD